MLGLELRAWACCVLLYHTATLLGSLCLHAAREIGRTIISPKVTERTRDNQEVLCLDLQGDSSELVLILHD